MGKIDKIKAIVEGTLGWRWMGQPSGLANVDLDGVEFPVVLFEPYRVGRMELRPLFNRTDTVELHFLRLAPDGAVNKSTADMDGGALIEAQEQTIADIRRFMAAYNASNLFKPIASAAFECEPPMFDAAEISVLLRFDCTEWEACL